MSDTPQNDVDAVFGSRVPNPPSKAQQSWGAVISIVVIVMMIVVGAFYAWGERIAEQNAYTNTTATTTESNTL